MIINREVLNSKPNKPESINENIDLFSYTLEVTGEMNSDISVFMEDVFFLSGEKKKIFDFEAILNAIIDAFINAIKKLFRKFLALLAHLASMGSSFEIELRAFKDKLSKFNGNVRMSEGIYFFTNLDPSVPGRDVYEFPNSMITLTSELFTREANKGALAPSKLAQLQQGFQEENERNKFRNILLHSRGSEDVGDFVKACFKFFRGTDSPISGAVIKGSDVYNNYYSQYIDAKSEIKKIEKERNEVEKRFKMIKYSIKKEYFNVNYSYFNEELKSQIQDQIITIQRRLCTVTDLMCQDLLVFYGQKLQAYKDFRIQCRKILVEAIKACIEQGG